MFACLTHVCFALSSAPAGGVVLLPYRDASLPIPQRARDLLSRMTVAEKVAQLLQPWETKSAAQVFAQFNTTGLGAWYLQMTDTRAPGGAGNCSGLVAARNAMQRLFVERTRLGIPVSFIVETLHSGGPGSTIFPMPANFGAAWNASAMTAAAAIIGAEARAVGADRGFSPVVNVFPDARFGRQQEGFAEDPHLTSVMGAAHVRGLQGPPNVPCSSSGSSDRGPLAACVSTDGIHNNLTEAETYLVDPARTLVATVKHFAAYGMSAGGIDGSPADLSEQRLHELYLRPWEYLARGRGLRSVMAAQNMVNGRPMHANAELLTRLLRQRWGATAALVVSDGPDCIGALAYGFHVAADAPAAALLAVRAGVDSDLGGVAFPLLAAAVAANHSGAAAGLERAAYNVLASKFAAGLFEAPYADETRCAALDGAPGRQLAREVAEQSIVLLRNSNATAATANASTVAQPGFLPLDFSALRAVALIGPLADDAASTVGGYTSFGAHVVTVREGLEEGMRHANPAAALRVARGTNAEDGGNATLLAAAVAAARASEVAVLVLGDTAATCGEMFDRSSLDLPGGQLALLEAVLDTGTPVVLVLVHGRSATFGPGNALFHRTAAALAAWRPGEEGGSAIFNLLSGVANPSGKLTQAWPRSAGGIGGPGAPYLYPFQGNHQGESYAVDGPSDAFLPFGVGGTYTSFRLEALEVTPAQAPPTGAFTLRLRAANTGARDGATVVQVYFRDPVAPVVRLASIQLVRFAKVFVAAGQSAAVQIELDAADLAYWNDGKNADADEDEAQQQQRGWVVDPGAFELFVSCNGFTSWNAPSGLKASVNVTG